MMEANMLFLQTKIPRPVMAGLTLEEQLEEDFQTKRDAVQAMREECSEASQTYVNALENESTSRQRMIEGALKNNATFHIRDRQYQKAVEGVLTAVHKLGIVASRLCKARQDLRKSREAYNKALSTICVPSLPT